MFHKNHTSDYPETENLNQVVDTMLEQKKANMESAKQLQKPKETRKERKQRKKATKMLRKKSKKLILPKSVQESIPYKRIYPDSGLIETRDGAFVRCYILSDINYTMLERREQDLLIHKYGELINSLDCASRFQVLTYQQMRDQLSFKKMVLMELGHDAMSDIREEHNELMENEIRKGRNEMHKLKYMCVEVTAPDYHTAANAFHRLDHEIGKGTKAIGGATATALSAAEYLELIYNIYNPTQVGTFGNNMTLDEKGQLVFAKERFSFDVMQQMGLTTKDVVGPESFGFEGSIGKTGSVYFRSLFIKDIPSKLRDYYLDKLTEVNCKVLVSIQYETIDMRDAERMVKNDLRSIQSNLIDRQKAATRSGYSADLLPSEMKNAYVDREFLHEELTSKSQKLFYQTIVITHFADTKEQLNEDTKTIQALGQSEFLTIRPLTGQELYGWYASLPLCCNPLKIKRTLLTQAAAMFIPFSCQEVLDLNGGIYYGKNSVSNNLILFDRRKGKNGNGFIIGTTGSGKSFMAKWEMENVIIGSEDHVIVIDPDGEYHRVGKRLGGEIIRIAPDSHLYLNPLDLEIIDEDVNSALTEKVNLVSSIFEAIFGDNSIVSATQKSVIDACVRNIYIPYLESRNPINGRYNRKKMPTLKELYYELRNQDSMDALYLSDALQRYAIGTQNFFAHRTNVRYHSRFVVYDIKDLGDSLKVLGELVVLNAVWSEICRGRKKGYRVWFYVDEVHLLLHNPQSTEFLKSLYKRARKYGGIPTGITQNISDILENPTACTMLSNSEFVILLSQGQQDIAALCDAFDNFSEAHIQKIKSVPPGHGLIYNGKDFIPFSNEIPQDSKLYRSMTTTLSEVIKIEQEETESEVQTNGETDSEQGSYSTEGETGSDPG